MRCAPASVRLGRYQFATTAEVTELIAKKHGRQARERAARIGLDADPAQHDARLLLEDRAARRADSGLRRVRRLRGAHGLSGAHGQADAAARAEDGRRRAARGRQGRRDGVLLQPEQPGGDRGRRQDHPRLRRRPRQELAGHHDAGGRGLLRVRHDARLRDDDPARGREPARGRRAHVLEVLRHGRSAHRLRHRSQGHDQASWRTGTAMAPSTCSASAPRAPRSTQSPTFLKDEKQAQHRRARLHAEVVQGSRLHADRFADQLHVRRHQAPGARLPRSLREAGHPRRPRLPAVREDALPHLGRHDGRDAEGGQGVRSRRWRSRRRRPRSARLAGTRPCPATAVPTDDRDRVLLSCASRRTNPGSLYPEESHGDRSQSVPRIARWPGRRRGDRRRRPRPRRSSTT